jgi:membrane protein YqaA with SNARE-associated domain
MRTGAGPSAGMAADPDPAPHHRPMTLVTLWITTFAVCVVGSIIPLVNTEIYLISVSALSPREFVLPLVVAATAGQMVGKVGMFYAGRGIVGMGSRKVRVRARALRARLRSRPHLAKVTLFSSATLGLPPLYVVSIACGTIGMGILSFVVIGAAGRLIHFAVVALLPQYARFLIG